MTTKALSRLCSNPSTIKIQRRREVIGTETTRTVLVNMNNFFRRKERVIELIEYFQAPIVFVCVYVKEARVLNYFASVFRADHNFGIVTRFSGKVH